MNNQDERILQLLRLAALAVLCLLLFLLFSGCSRKDYQALQTQVHDIKNVVIENQVEQKVQKNLIQDCVFEKVVFQEDSFGFYTWCPNEAKPLKKAVIKKSFNLTHAD